MKSFASLVLVLTALALPAWGVPCDLADLTLLRPNLVGYAPEHVRVLERGGVRQLRFITRIANLGDGPLQLASSASGGVGSVTQIVTRSDGSTCERFLGTFPLASNDRFSRLPDYARYFVRADDPLTGPVVASGSLSSYCITDVASVTGSDTPRQVHSSCAGTDTTEGLSVGWSDVYDNRFEEQTILLDSTGVGSVPAGTYFLVIVPDAGNLLLETEENSPLEYGVATVSVPRRMNNASLPPGPTVLLPPSTPPPTATPLPLTANSIPPTSRVPTAVTAPTATGATQMRRPRPMRPAGPPRPTIMRSSRPARPQRLPRPTRISRAGSFVPTPTGP